ncbi:MAG: bifunctional UDP-2,4-diacetamido-2,4,6-trideoxy-beta-L-altropyranose hydrolase/GNAT family N-acetyltransferase [Patescibacteria group bacterium]
MTNTVLVRVDSNYHVGMGHIMRCVALAHEFKRRGIKPTFLIKNYKEAKFILDKNSMDYLCLPKIISMEKEVEFINQSAKDANTRILAIDLKKIPALYIQALKNKGFFLICFSDFEKIRKSAADLIIAGESYYKNKEEGIVRGLDYIITGRTSIRYNKRKKIINKVKRILLSFGGGDNGGVFIKVLRALEKSRHRLEFNLIVGATFKRHSLLKKIINKTKLNLNIIENTNSMAKYLYNTDVAFISGGATKYEAACIGTPSFIIAQDNRQFKYSRRFSELTKAAICLGRHNKLKVRNIHKQVDPLFCNKQLLRKMSDAGKLSVDGLGARRIVDRILYLQSKILYPSISLRLATRKDLPLLLKWFNDPELRQFSITSKKITLTQHRKWFTSLNKRKNKIFAVDLNGQHIGTAALRNIDSKNRQAELAIEIGEKEYWGKGYGTLIIKQLLEYGFNKLNLRSVYLSVFSKNNRAVNLYKKIGFSLNQSEKKIINKDGKRIELSRMNLDNKEYFRRK